METAVERKILPRGRKAVRLEDPMKLVENAACEILLTAAQVLLDDARTETNKCASPRCTAGPPAESSPRPASPLCAARRQNPGRTGNCITLLRYMPAERGAAGLEESAGWKYTKAPHSLPAKHAA